LGAAIGLRDLIGWRSISHLCEVNTVPGNHSRSTGRARRQSRFRGLLCASSRLSHCMHKAMLKPSMPSGKPGRSHRSET
jgi:hypothetical protein